MAAVLTLVPAEAAGADIVESDALVRVVQVAPGLAGQAISARVGGAAIAADLRVGEATGFRRLPAGAREVRVDWESGSAAATLPLTAGCQHTLLVAQPEGMRQAPRILNVAECGINRIPPGHAAIRLVNATSDNGAVLLGPLGGPPSPPFTASQRGHVVAGPREVEVRSPRTGETLSTRRLTLSADEAYTVLYYGGGEVPLSLILLSDGAQPPAPPPPGVPINTGAPNGPGRGLAVILALAVAVGCALVGRRGLRPAVAALALLAACGTPAGERPAAPSPTGSPPPSSGGRPHPEPRPESPSALVPARLRIPSLGLDAEVVARSARDVADLPRLLDARRVAWLEGTTAPGAVGVAVLAGHVVGGAGEPAVFGDLGRLRRGDRIVVSDASGRSLHFAVRSTVTLSKPGVWPHPYSPTPEPTVLLVTCTDRDPLSGAYLSNLLVRATLVES